MPRTDATLVESLLSYNYDGTSSLTIHINTAYSIVNRLAALATSKGISYSQDDLTLVETWLAAHWYTRTDPLYMSKNTDKAAGSWGPREYLEGAIAADPTGLLAALLDPSKRAGGAWLGKTETEQLTYRQRMG